jgi:hypothetical protein
MTKEQKFKKEYSFELLKIAQVNGQKKFAITVLHEIDK